MATKQLKKGLGRGLENLLGPKVTGKSPLDGDDAPDPAGVPRILKLSALQPGKYQPRTRMDEGALYELAESIKTQGIMQPILVRPVGRERYEIIAGERRSRAAKLAGITEVPVLIRDVPDEAAAAMALIENIQREDLNPLEEAHGLQRLTKEFGLTHEQAAQSVGRSRSAASNLLRLLQLADPVQSMLMAGDLDMGHARALLGLDKAHQITTAAEIAAKQLSVREAEALVTRHMRPNPSGGATKLTQKGKSRDVKRLEEELSDWLMAPVDIRVKKKTKRGEQGEVVIGFGSLDELNGVLERMRHDE